MGAFIVGFAHEQGVLDFRGKVAVVRGHTRVRMRVADTAIGQYQAFEHMILATGPDGSATVLVAGKVFDHRFQPRAVGVAGIRIGQMRVPAKVEFTLCIGAAIDHQPVDVGVGDVAGKLLQLHPTGPSSLTDLCAFKLTRWMFWESHPEACCLRTCGHIPAVSMSGFVIQKVDTVLSEGIN